MEIILRYVNKYGWMPIVIEDGKETYRGEFYKWSYEALEAANDFLDGEDM